MRALAKVRRFHTRHCPLVSRYCQFAVVADGSLPSIQLVATNNPDKILFVGEALVGNEAVDQLTKFDRALRDFSASSGGQERGIDGMLVTKWDTVDDKVRPHPAPLY